MSGFLSQVAERSAARMLDLLGAAGFDVAALSPAGDAVLSDLSLGVRAAVLLGAEGPGLPAALLSRVKTVRIPMAGGFDSLNVATTSGIVLHHRNRGRT